MTAPPRIAPVSPGRRRVVALLAALAFLVVPFVAGYEMGDHHRSSSVAVGGPGSVFGPGSATNPLPGRGSGPSDVPGSGTSGSTATPQSTGRIDVRSIADKIDDSVVNIRVAYGDRGGEAAGTGMVISSAGLVLTNNHVIENAADLQVELAATGETKSAKVLGYSLVNDVALLQVQGVSGLRAVDLGASSTLRVGDPIVALGNAGGRGGAPSVVTGNVTSLDREITASDSDGSNVQTLTGLIQVNANIQAGDSGGPLVDATGTVVGMNAAASIGNGGGGFRFPGQSTANEGYAIPIETALAVAKKIQAGTSTSEVHVGAERAVLGVKVQADAGARRNPFGGSSGNGTGAVVLGVDDSSGAAKAGIRTGDVITGLDGRSVSSGSDLTKAMVRYSPGDSVQVTWVDSAGDAHRATVKLGRGSPA